MLWRYHIFLLLVGVHSSRIFTSSAGVGQGVFQLSEDELLETIVQQISHGNAKPQGTQVKKDAKDDQSSNFAQRGIVQPVAKEKLDNKDDPTTTPSSPPEHAVPGKTAAFKHQPHAQGQEKKGSSHLLSKDDTKFAIFVGAGLAAGFIGIMLAGVCYYKFRRSAKAASDIGYPAYGVTGPMKEKIPSPGDRKLAQSAQMYHYQHQKQQMIAMEKANGDMKHDASEDESEEDNVEGDYTVYECPGLAPTGEMEVKNPLFCGDEINPPPTHPEYATPSDYQGQGEAEGRQSPSSPSSQPPSRNQ